MKKTTKITIELNKYDFKKGIMKSFYDDSLSLSDFKVPMKEFYKADLVIFNGLGLNDVPLGGKCLKDRHDTMDFQIRKKQAVEKKKLVEEQKETNRSLFEIFVGWCKNKLQSNDNRADNNLNTSGK